MKFKYKDGLAPRSIVEFCFKNGTQWNQIGESQTYGDYINLKKILLFLKWVAGLMDSLLETIG